MGTDEYLTTRYSRVPRAPPTHEYLCRRGDPYLECWLPSPHPKNKICIGHCVKKALRPSPHSPRQRKTIQPLTPTIACSVRLAILQASGQQTKGNPGSVAERPTGLFLRHAAKHRALSGRAAPRRCSVDSVGPDAFRRGQFPASCGQSARTRATPGPDTDETNFWPPFTDHGPSNVKQEASLPTRVSRRRRRPRRQRHRSRQGRRGRRHRSQQPVCVTHPAVALFSGVELHRCLLCHVTPQPPPCGTSAPLQKNHPNRATAPASRSLRRPAFDSRRVETDGRRPRRGLAALWNTRAPVLGCQCLAARNGCRSAETEFV